VCVEKSVTKVQIVGLWKATKRKDLPYTMTKMMGTEITSSMAIVTIVTKRATKKLTAGRNNVKTQIMWKKNTRYDDKQYKKTNVEEWIGDTGETCHMKSNTNGMYGLEKCKGI